MTWVERRLKKNKANAKEERENKTEKKLSSSVSDWEKHERLSNPALTVLATEKWSRVTEFYTSSTSKNTRNQEALWIFYSGPVQFVKNWGGDAKTGGAKHLNCPIFYRFFA